MRRHPWRDFRALPFISLLEETAITFNLAFSLRPLDSAFNARKAANSWVFTLAQAAVLQD